jgi:hypothetical protein
VIVLNLLQELMVVAIRSFHLIGYHNDDGNLATEVEDESQVRGYIQIFEVMTLMVLLKSLTASHHPLTLASFSLSVRHGGFLPIRTLYSLFGTACKAKVQVSSRYIWVRSNKDTLAKHIRYGLDATMKLY